jgi:POT family proton-dependent oligopeptide transporter
VVRPFGGWLADRLVGMERMVFAGGCVVMLGHVALAVLPGLPGVGAGLTLVALGSGALKANASSLLGTLYPAGDPRRDGGFTLFYLGINLGAFIGPIVTGLLRDAAGFHVGFAAAAVGMALGLIQYAVFRRNLGTAGRAPTNPLPADRRPLALAAVTLGSAALVVLLLVVVPPAALKYVTSAIILLVAVGFFAVLLTSPRVTGPERGRVRAFVPLFLANAAFWSLFQQIFTTLAVYSDQRMDWTVLGWRAPSSFIGAEEPVWIILLSPVFAALWTRLGRRAPSTPVKFAVGVIGMGLAFLLFLLFAGGSGRTTPAVAVLGILAVFAGAELMLSPIGLSVTTQLAPEAFRAQMMALYFLSVGLGTALSGALAGFYTPEHEARYFAVNGAVVIAIGVVMVALAPGIRRRMAGVH